MTTYVFHVRGMHCPSCVHLIEGVLGELPGIQRVSASLREQRVEVTDAFDGRTAEEVARDLDAALRAHGYALSVEKSAATARWADFQLALPLAGALVAVFILLQKFGLVNLVATSKAGPGMAFFLGVVASLSSCLAVVGGLALSLAASFAKGGDRVWPQVLFHAGRLGSFFLLGGLVGAIGAAVRPDVHVNFVGGLLVAGVMVLLGINLLEIFPWARRFQPALPPALHRQVMKLKHLNHTVTPLLAGAATFFLPCGFTQAMQLYSLNTGSFWAGAATMFSFALGTLPVLALLSFSSLFVHRKENFGVFFKTAGLVVIFFGLSNLWNSLAAVGAVPPLFNF